MLRYHPCAVGFACIELACSARGFDVAPLREGLEASGIRVEVRATARVLAARRWLPLPALPPTPESTSAG
jgi:hypothetical protein